LDYQELLFRTPGYRQFLETLFATQTVLFVGFSGNDPDLDNVIDRLASIYSRTLDNHFILLPAKRLNPTEKRRYALDRRLEVIEYQEDPSHSQVEVFLRELSAQAGRPATASTQRARRSTQLKIFISYSQDDRSSAAQLAELLRAIGYEIVFDLANEVKAVELNQALSEAFSIAEIIIVLYTEHAARSEWVRYEAELALTREVENKTVVIPILLGSGILPPYFRDRPIIQLPQFFTTKDVEPLLQLLKRLAAERVGNFRKRSGSHPSGLDQ
jgi:hypothetical protein